MISHTSNNWSKKITAKCEDSSHSKCKKHPLTRYRTGLNNMAESSTVNLADVWQS